MTVLSIAACTNENTSKKDNSASAPATNSVAPTAKDVIVIGSDPNYPPYNLLCSR
ncbi:hypothetical protein [Kingella kingae]|uniref:hypothetical protein n=1 Tax=Kingella kingae TaxID=504 RepID=UPI0012BCD102|nr:hypothetical protein [Kingella kingae]MDK4576646.1 hypothetical protein [Kingella kingae]MDK4582717.1 hypothetical protein [Kingella kingae]MDK4646694.1 hypothetical protein [Kingella kingae]MDK4664402.1 hypothetical protein [Kingella kingae]MDK4670361.1 hypothetical protein [Kingella kingae]